MQDLLQDLSNQRLPATPIQPPTRRHCKSNKASTDTSLGNVRNTSQLPPQGIRSAAELISATYFREADEARFMRTGGRRCHRVKGVDARVAIAGALAIAFVKDADKRAEEVWWAIANHHFDLTALEQGSVNLLKRKNELLEVVRNVHALMPEIERTARRAFDDAIRTAE